MNRLAARRCLAAAIVSAGVTSLVWKAKDQPEAVTSPVEAMTPVPAIRMMRLYASAGGRNRLFPA